MRVYIVGDTGVLDGLALWSMPTPNVDVLLYVNQGTLRPDVKAEIQRLGPSEIIIVGGESRVSSYVQDQLVELAPTVKRTAGGNRFTTAIAISRVVHPPADTGSPYDETGRLVSITATVSETDFYTGGGDTILWQDGFESGNFDEWQIAISGDATATIDAGTKHSGSYAAKLANWNMDNPTSAGARLTPGGDAYEWYACTNPYPDDTYYSVWYYIPFAFEGQSNVFQFKSSDATAWDGEGNITSHTWRMIWKISFIWDAPTEKYIMQIGTRVNQTDGAWYDTVLVQGATDPIVPVGEWFHIETRYIWGMNWTGATTIWLNGTQVYDQQNMCTEANNLECWHWRRTWAVNHYLGDWQGPVTPADSWMFVDDAKMADYRVGTG